MKVAIMAGGQGTRFWPMSTAAKPKQFLALTSSRTMIQETYSRFRHRVPQEDVYIVTTRDYVTQVREQLPEVAEDHIIVEPERRDTCPCIALTTHYLLQNGTDDVLVTAPSDQYIPDFDAFHQALNEAERLARLDRAIVTLGIRPTRPETGFGYIQAEQRDPAGDSGVVGASIVRRFLEKPTLPVAQELIRRDHIYWNSGIFIWKLSTIAYYMEKHAESIWEPIVSSNEVTDEIYSSLPKISIDYAILEKADLIFTIPVDFIWDDVGTWGALERVKTVDNSGNITEGFALLHSSKNTIAVSTDKKLIVVGVEDLIIVSTEAGILVCHKSQEQLVKPLVKGLE